MRPQAFSLFFSNFFIFLTVKKVEKINEFLFISFLLRFLYILSLFFICIRKVVLNGVDGGVGG